MGRRARVLPMQDILRDYYLGMSFTALGQVYRCCPKMIRDRISEHTGERAESNWTEARAANLAVEVAVTEEVILLLIRARLQGASYGYMSKETGLTTTAIKRILSESAERVTLTADR